MVQFPHDIPEELLSQICQWLCLHCLSPTNSIPDFDTPSERENKNSLSRVAKTCRTLRRIAQPVMFHYCVTGFIPRKIGGTNWMRKTQRPHILYHFLRTLVQRPDLASQTTVLSLAPFSRHHVGRQIDIEPGILTLIENFVEHSFESLQKSRLVPPHKRTVLVYLLEPIIVSFLPNLKSLLLSPGGQNGYISWAFVPPLDSLKLLALVPWDYDPWSERKVCISDLQRVFEKAPHLETLDLANCGYINRFTAEKWNNVSLAEIKNLRVDGHELILIQQLLDYCPKIQELDLHINPLIRPPDMLKMNHFEPCRRTLRRLVLSVSRLDYTSSRNCGFVNSRPMHEYYLEKIRESINRLIGGELADSRWEFSFHEFDSLQILEIEQCILYGYNLENTTSIDPLSQRLPESIEILHVGIVISWKHLFQDFDHLLSRRRMGGLANFRLIRIDPFFEEIPEDEFQDAEIRLATAGIKLIVGTNPRGLNLRGMLPDWWSNYDDKPTTRLLELSH